MKTLALILVLSVMAVGCGQKKEAAKPPVYVPTTWTAWTALREIRTVWFLNIKGMDTTDVVQMRMIVQRVWEADRDGKTLDEIDKEFVERKLSDILENGV
jgi:hypothetical protein